MPQFSPQSWHTQNLKLHSSSSNFSTARINWISQPTSRQTPGIPYLARHADWPFILSTLPPCRLAWAVLARVTSAALISLSLSLAREQAREREGGNAVHSLFSAGLWYLAAGPPARASRHSTVPRRTTPGRPAQSPGRVTSWSNYPIRRGDWRVRCSRVIGPPGDYCRRRRARRPPE